MALSWLNSILGHVNGILNPYIRYVRTKPFEIRTNIQI